jgi:hypothetical protein
MKMTSHGVGWHNYLHKVGIPLLPLDHLSKMDLTPHIILVVGTNVKPSITFGSYYENLQIST